MIHVPLFTIAIPLENPPSTGMNGYYRGKITQVVKEWNNKQQVVCNADLTRLEVADVSELVRR